MRDASGVQAWLRFGRFLPRQIRERVYEPACRDAYIEAAGEGRGESRPWTLIGMALDSLRVGFPFLFIHRRRLTRMGRLTLAAVFVVLVLLTAIMRTASTYQTTAAGL